MTKYEYMVDTRGPKPDLVRCSKDVFERYTPNRETPWSRSKFLDEFAWGGGDFIYFDDICEADAEKYMSEIDEYWKNKEDSAK